MSQNHITIVPQKPIDVEKLNRALILDDTSKLSPEEKTNYVNALCQSCGGLNPLSKPFGFFKFKDGRETVYALKNCAEQLRVLRGISLEITGRNFEEGVYIVVVRARNAQGRTDESTGAVAVKGLSGDQLANALMKTETKAKRRVTLSICGLGMLDESELETIPGVTIITESVKSAPPPDNEKQSLVAELRKLVSDQVTTWPQVIALAKKLFNKKTIALTGSEIQEIIRSIRDEAEQTKAFLERDDNMDNFL